MLNVLFLKTIPGASCTVGEGKATGITGKAFMKKYRLQTASVVTAAVRSLLDKDLITNDKGVYQVYAPFFSLWIKSVV